MTARGLRVGVLIGDNLVEERMFLGSAPITIGQSLRSTLSIPVDGVPHDHVLFVRDQGRTSVRVTPQMTLRLSEGGQGGEIRTDLRHGPPDPHTADRPVWTIPLDHGARGKLKLGEATILFQEVAAPPLAPRPRLPASIRGTLADRIDRRLAVVVGASLTAHLAIATWAWQTERETEPPPASALRPYHQETIEISMADELELPATNLPPGDQPVVAPPVAPNQTPRPIVPSRSVTPRAEPGMSTSDANRYAQILTGNDEQRGGPGAMHDRQPVADLNQQIRDIVDEHRRVEVGSPPRTRPDRPRLGTTPTPDIHAPDQLSQLPAHRDEPRDGRIELVPIRKPPPGGPGDTFNAIVLHKIETTYIGGLQRCYKKGLVHDQLLRGKVALSFTVDEQGRVTEPAARGMTAEVDACIQGFMQTWRFPFPRDQDGDPTDAAFALSLAFQPS